MKMVTLCILLSMALGCSFTCSPIFYQTQVITDDEKKESEKK